MPKFVVSFLVLLFVSFLPQISRAQSTPAPAWFLRDVVRNAAWIPTSVRQQGWEKVAIDYFYSLPTATQYHLSDLKAPLWMLALAPQNIEVQPEILKQLSMVQVMAGTPSFSPLAARAEQLLLLTGALQLPTPGDERSGQSLGAQGCTAAMTKYILSELKLEFPEKMSWLPENIAISQSSPDVLRFFRKLASSANSPIQISEVPYQQLTVYHVQPGDFMVGQKPGGTHVFAWTRVPSAWNWSPGSLMAIANTGLKSYGQRMIFAQEYLTDNTYEPSHNEHGPINSGQVVYKGNQIDLSDPRTNVYAAENASFVIIRLRY
jgi:hypothetical protein